jgi:hypothetical protein
VLLYHTRAGAASLASSGPERRGLRLSSGRCFATMGVGPMGGLLWAARRARGMAGPATRRRAGTSGRLAVPFGVRHGVEAC